MNRIKVLLFATLRDYVGERALDLQLPSGATVAELKTLLIEKYPRLASARGSMMAAVNQEYAADEQTVPPDAEIAFFPPVSGG